MSDNIEKRSLELEFKHKQFEAAVSKTLTSLDKLNKSLNMQEARRGLEEFKKDSNRFDLSGVSNALEKVEKRFESFGYRLKVNVFDKIIRYSEDIAKSIMITPISTGYSEYGLLLDSIRVIKSSTGESVETIQGYLDELNEYSDKTIYSFSDMTRNIGKFTNAGIKLDVATKAIQGISNAAALAGVSAAQAEHAMYNLAQALPAGYVRYRDWWSVVNANMATVEFKQQLIDTAEELGTLTKVGDNLWKTTKQEINAIKNFDTSLNDAWLTTEVLTTTLEKYADETTAIGKKAYEAAGEVTTFNKMLTVLRETSQSGWAMSWRQVIGDYDDAKAFFTGLTKIFSDILNKQADSRNLALQEWKELGGREKLLKSIRYILMTMESIVRSISIGWENVFGKVGGKQLLSWTKALEKGSKKLQDFFIVKNIDKNGNVTTEWTQNGLKLINISTGIASIFSILISLMQQMGVASIILFKPMLRKFMPGWMINLIAILKLTGLLKPFLGMLYDLVTITGLFFQNLHTYLKENKTFQSAFSKFKDAWEPIRSEIEKAMNSFVLFYSSLLLGDDSLNVVSGLLRNFLEILTPVGQILGVTLEYAKKFFGYFFEEIKDSQVVRDFTNTLGSLWKSVEDFFIGLYESFIKNPLTDEQIADAAKKTWEGILTFFGQVSTKLSTWVTNIFGFFSDIGPNFKDAFSSIWETVKVIFSQVIELISEFFTSLDLGDKIKGTYDSISESISSKSKMVLDSITKFFKNIEKYFEDNPLNKEIISEKASSVWEFLVSLFKSTLGIIKKMVPVFKYIGTALKTFVEAFIEFGKSSGLFDLVIGIFTTFGQMIGSLFNNIVNYVIEHPIDIEKIKSTAQEFVNDLILLLLSPIEGLKNIGGKVWNSISDFFLKIFVPISAAEELFPGDSVLKIVDTESWKNLQNTKKQIAQFEENGFDFIDWIGERFGNIKDGLTKFLGEQDAWIRTLPSYVVAVSRLWFTHGIISGFSKISSSISNVIGEIKNVSKSMTEFKRGYKEVEIKKARALQFIASVFLIASMAGAVYLLASIEDVNKMWNAVAALSTFYLIYSILSSLTGRSKSINKIEIGKGLYNLAATILMLVTSLGLVAGAIYLLNDIDITQFSDGLTNLGQLASLAVGVSTIVSLIGVVLDRASGRTKSNFSGMEFLWVSATIAAFATMLIWLSQYKLSDFKESFKIVSALSFGILILITLLGLANKFAGPLPSKGVKGLISIAGAISLLIGPILVLNLLGKNVWRPVGAVVGLIVALGVALAAMSKIQNPVTGSIGIIAIIASVYLLLTKISDMVTEGVNIKEVSDLVVAIAIALGGLGVALAGLAAAAAGFGGAGKLLGSGGPMSLLLGLLGELGTALVGTVILQALLNFVDGIASFVYDITGKLVNMSDDLEKVSLDNLGKLKIAISTISSAIYSIPPLDQLKKVKKFSDAIIDLSGAFTASAYGFSQINLFDILKAITSIRLMSGAMKSLEKIDPRFNYQKAATAFVALGSALDLYNRFTTGINGSVDSAGDVGNISGSNKKKYNVEELDKFLQDIIKLAPDKELMATLAEYSVDDQSGASLTSWAVGINAIARAVASIGLGDEEIDFSRIENVIDALQKLKEINEGLVGVGIAVKHTKESGIDEARKAFSTESWALQIDTPGFENALKQLATDIGNLGTSFNGFGLALSDVNIDYPLVEKGMSLIGELSTLYTDLTTKVSELTITLGSGYNMFSSPLKINLSGLITSLHGNALTRFSGGLQSLGHGFQDFAEALGVFRDPETGTILDAEQVLGNAERGTGVIGSLAKINESLSESGGLNQWVTGTKNLSLFSSNVGKLGEAFNKFGIGVSLFKDPDTKKILNASEVLGNADKSTGIIGALAEINNQLSPTGGFVNLWKGDVKLDQFARDIGSLGTNLNTFATETASIKWEDSQWETHIKPFFDYFKDIGSTGNWFTGISSFSSGLTTLASSMRNFINDFDIYFDIEDPYSKTIIDQQMDNMVTGVKDYMAHMKEAFSGSDSTISQVTQFNSALSELQTLLSAEMETQPVITPVLDLTQITSDVDDLNNLITPNRMFRVRAINNNAQASDLQSRMFMANGNIIINDDHSDIVTAVKNLGPKIDNLNTSLSSLKIVMNTGVLAGELTGPINKNLGKMASRGRGGS